MAVDLPTLSSAIGVGFLMSAPIGPVSLLSIRRALSGDPLAAFATGTGVVICDLMVAAAGLAGFQAVRSLLDTKAGYLMMACGIILLVAAAGGLRRKPEDFAGVERGGQSRSKRAAALGGLSLQGLIITLGNPLNAAAVATMTAGLLNVERSTDIPPVVAALGLGCLLWWAGLAIGVHRLRHRVDARLLSGLNMIISLVLGLAGLVALGFGAAHLFGLG